MSNLIRKPSQIEAKSTLSMLIYGQPGVGKTTLGCSAPNPVLFDYDGGVSRVNGAHQVPTVQIRSWEDTEAALQEIEQTMPEVQTIVIDTVGKMLDYMSSYIIRQDSRMGQRDGSLQLKGYGVRKTMFINFIKRVSVMGKNVVFIAHEKEEKQGDVTVKRPEIGGSSAGDLIKELELVGYVQMHGTTRKIFFNPREEFYAKNTCNLPSDISLTALFDESGAPSAENNYLTRMIGYYKAQQEKRQEQVKAYEKLMENINTALSSAKDADGLNAIKASVDKQPAIFDSIVASRNLLNRKAEALGLVFDTVSSTYQPRA